VQLRLSGLVAVSLLAVFLVASSTTTLGMVLFLPYARRHIVDVPNERSSHSLPTPRGGGLAVVVGLLTGCMVSGLTDRTVVFLVLGTLVMAVVGMADDVRGLAVVPRLVAQVALSLLVSASLVSGQVSSMAVAVALVAVGGFWLTGFINVFNFMDGINGVSGLTVVVTCSWYLSRSEVRDHRSFVLLLLSLLGATLAFLPWNFPRARVFLGDVGSYALGALLGGMAMASLLFDLRLQDAIAPLLIFLGDAGWTLGLRVRRGEKWWQAHREHVYQQLSVASGHPAAVAAMVALFSIAACAVSQATAGLPFLWFTLTATLVIVYLSLPCLWKVALR
jgi:UDP-GlcNAc:undecaprenyl-phosphate GlcNAc-1-phosphate transferase